MNLEHLFEIEVQWQGNLGSGTSDYRAYSRDHVVFASANPQILGSSHRVFHGSAERWNPEQMLVAALSQCHMLSYLHVAASNGVVVQTYTDRASGIMQQTDNGGGHFTSVTLRPVVHISAGDLELARMLHREANEKCFIASSVNFPVHHEPTVNRVED